MSIFPIQVPKERAEEWAKRYNEGESLHDLRASEAAAGRSTDFTVIRRELTALEVKFRTVKESQAMARKRSKMFRKYGK